MLILYLVGTPKVESLGARAVLDAKKKHTYVSLNY